MQQQQLRSGPGRTNPSSKRACASRVINYLVSCRKNIDAQHYEAARIAAGDRSWLRGLWMSDLERAWTHAFLDQVLRSLARQPADHSGARYAIDKARRYWQHPERNGA